MYRDRLDQVTCPVTVKIDPDVAILRENPESKIVVRRVDLKAETRLLIDRDPLTRLVLSDDRLSSYELDLLPALRLVESTVYHAMPTAQSFNLAINVRVCQKKERGG